MTTESWLPVAEFAGRYQVSNLGRVRVHHGRGRLHKQPKEVSQRNNGNGYMAVSLGPKGERVSRYVHRLVALAFHGTPLPGHEVNHRNGIRHDNRANNLFWASHAANISARNHSRGPAHSAATHRAWATRRANAA